MAQNLPMYKISTITVLLFVVFSTFEFGVRLTGYTPFNHHIKKDKISEVVAILPESYLRQDSLLGYSLKPGSFSTIYKSGFMFHSTHDCYGNRVTCIDSHQLHRSEDAMKIFIYGDSYFYGFGLDDTATFGYKLQQRLSGDHIVNKAIMGQSAVCTMLRLKEDISHNSKPDVAIIQYASYDLSREVFSKHMQRSLRVHKSAVKHFNYPFARISNGALALKYAGVPRNNIPLARYSALYNLFETTYLDYEQNSLNPAKVNALVYEEIIDMCVENDIIPVIAFVTDNCEEKKAEFDRKGAVVLDFAGPLLQDRYTLLPYDRHPNGKAHSAYADLAFAALDSI